MLICHYLRDDTKVRSLIDELFIPSFCIRHIREITDRRISIDYRRKDRSFPLVVRWPDNFPSHFRFDDLPWLSSSSSLTHRSMLRDTFWANWTHLLRDGRHPTDGIIYSINNNNNEVARWKFFFFISFEKSWKSCVTRRWIDDRFEFDVDIWSGQRERRVNIERISSTSRTIDQSKMNTERTWHDGQSSKSKRLFIVIRSSICKRTSTCSFRWQTKFIENIHRRVFFFILFERAQTSEEQNVLEGHSEFHWSLLYFSSMTIILFRFFLSFNRLIIFLETKRRSSPLQRSTSGWSMSLALSWAQQSSTLSHLSPSATQERLLVRFFSFDDQMDICGEKASSNPETKWSGTDFSKVTRTKQTKFRVEREIDRQIVIDQRRFFECSGNLFLFVVIVERRNLRWQRIIPCLTSVNVALNETLINVTRFLHQFQFDRNRWWEEKTNGFRSFRSIGKRRCKLRSEEFLFWTPSNIVKVLWVFLHSVEIFCVLTFVPHSNGVVHKCHPIESNSFFNWTIFGRKDSSFDRIRFSLNRMEINRSDQYQTKSSLSLLLLHKSFSKKINENKWKGREEETNDFRRFCRKELRERRRKRSTSTNWNGDDSFDIDGYFLCFFVTLLIVSDWGIQRETTDVCQVWKDILVWPMKWKMRRRRRHSTVEKRRLRMLPNFDYLKYSAMKSSRTNERRHPSRFSRRSRVNECWSLLTRSTSSLINERTFGHCHVIQLS